MKRTKVLIITQQYSPEGNAFRISDMSKHLNDLLDVLILSPHPTVPIGTFKKVWKLSNSFKINNINIINLWTWQPSSTNPNFVSRMAYYLLFSMHSVLWVLLNSKKYDLIITSTPPIFIDLPGLCSKLIFKKPWIIDVRDLWIDASIGLGFLKKGSIYEKISRKFEHFCYVKADMVCVTTEELKKKLLQEYSIDPDKMVVIPNGVDIKTFKPITSDKKSQLIYSGNVGHAQDLEKVILALKLIDKKYQLKLLIVGDGDIKNHLVDIVNENKLSDDVIFTGAMPRDKVPQLISESMVGIAPLKNIESLEYAIPTKVYEYMACSVPFIGCGKGEIQNIANESKAGLIAKNDPEDIARNIIYLLENTGTAKEMGFRGREYAEKFCDRKTIALNLKNYIDQLVKKADNVTKPNAEVVGSNNT